MEHSMHTDSVVSQPSPSKTSRFPINHHHHCNSSFQVLNEKAPSRTATASSSSSPSARWSPGIESTPARMHSYPARPSEFSHPPNCCQSPSSHYCTRSSGVPCNLRPWVPIIMYAITSFAFVIAFAFYKDQLFQFLDELSLWLRSDENYGHLVLFFLIFLTTIPPVPLYSTLIVLSGYTFGALTGAVISYCAALSGAIVVFTLSRSLLRDYIEHWLNSLISVRRVIRAIEKRPKLLFLIRLAPYPYNVMNCLLAASSTLTLQTFTVCTALSLFKVIIHTYIGASIHSFKTYHMPSSSRDTDWVTQLSKIAGVSLCFALLVYLAIIARRAIDDELDDSPMSARDSDTRAFLSGANRDIESGHAYRDSGMSEIPFRTLHVPSSQTSSSVTRH